MPRKPASAKRRSAQNAPADCLGTVVSEFAARGLQPSNAHQPSDQILDSCRSAFTGFSAEELALLDGVILEPAAAHRR